MSAPTEFDSGKTEAFAGRFLTALNNGALCLMVSICHRTGLFYVMSQSPPATSESVAARAGLNERGRGRQFGGLRAVHRGEWVVSTKTSSTMRTATSEASSPSAGNGSMNRIAVPLFIAVALLGPGMVAGQNDVVITERNKCQGEGCGPGEVRANDNIPVYSADSRTATIAYWIPRSERFHTLTANLHHSPPGLALVSRTLDLESVSGERVPALQEGDTITIFGYRGEGVYTIVARGTQFDVFAFWEDRKRSPLPADPPARLLREAFTDEWIKVRNRSGAEGWVLWSKDLFYSVER